MNEKAMSGDLIQVTKAFDEPYKIGDIMEVEMRETDCDDMILTTEGYTLKDDEYKIFNRHHAGKTETVQTTTESTIKRLAEQLTKNKGTDIHFRAENIFETQNLTAVISVYDNIKPADKVLAELIAWSEEHQPETAMKIKELKKDMSWNPRID